MEIIWDPDKYTKLLVQRGIDLDEVKLLIENTPNLKILEHPTRPGQFIIPIVYKSYVHIVPVVIDKNKMILKTCYPSRKAHKKYSRS
jgi:uncharacterized DUF497 family protein